jgi:hypothetical protein
MLPQNVFLDAYGVVLIAILGFGGDLWGSDITGEEKESWGVDFEVGGFRGSVLSGGGWCGSDFWLVGFRLCGMHWMGSFEMVRVMEPIPSGVSCDPL